MKTVIFDFDGTIADTFRFTFDIVKELAPKYGYEPLSVEEIELLREMSFKDIIRKYKIGPVKLLRMTLDAHAAFLNNVNLIVNTEDIENMTPALERALRDYNDVHRSYNETLGLSPI